MGAAERVIWAPQKGPQKALIDCPVPEVFYGGARGGGKTDGVIGKYALKDARYPGQLNAVIFRRELPMLDDLIERSHQVYEPLGGQYNEQKKTWKMPNGGRLRFRPLERPKDADKYQGQNLTDACTEEAGQYASPVAIDRLWGAMRSGGGVPVQLLLTGNPGGAGQLWIKQRYIDPWPSGMKVQTRVLPNGKEHKFVFIPSKLQNNAALLRGDPEYINRLYLVGNKELVRAWLEGDWSAIEGAFFSDWSQDLIVDPFEIPEHWTRFVSFDWGYARPFSVGWWAIASEDFITPEGVIPQGAMVRYREWYGAKKQNGETMPNVGLKLTAEEVGQGIRKRTAEKINDWVADPAIFAEDGGPSIFERMGIPFRKADNRRVGRLGQMGGWDMMRQRMRGKMMFVFSTCTDFIRTVPVQQHDEMKPEDLDTDGEDHVADESRYACMARPWISDKPDEPRKGIEIREPTLDELFEMQSPGEIGRI